MPKRKILKPYKYSNSVRGKRIKLKIRKAKMRRRGLI